MRHSSGKVQQILLIFPWSDITKTDTTPLRSKLLELTLSGRVRPAIETNRGVERWGLGGAAASSWKIIIDGSDVLR
jgi:hypothetical protein